MAEFLTAVEALLKKEAGFVDDADDRGGATNYGISSRRFPEISISTLTREQAIELYWSNYWNPLYDRLEAQVIADKLLELTVHMAHDAARPFYAGRMKGIEIVQRACRSLGDREVMIDGMFGPQTLQAVKLERPEVLLAAIRVEQMRHYLALADKDESQRKFLRGWIRRALVALALCLLPVIAGAQFDALEGMEHDFFRLNGECNALPAEERRIGGEEFRLKRYRCGHRVWQLWQYRCPEGYWSRVMKIDQADSNEASYYLDRFAGWHRGQPADVVQAYRAPCRA